MQEQNWLNILSHLNLRAQYGEMLARTRGHLSELDAASLALVANAALRQRDTEVLAEVVPLLERLAPDLDTSLDIFFRDSLLRGVRRDVAALQQQVGDFAPLIEDGTVDQAASLHLRAHAWRDLEYLLQRCAEDVDDLPSSLLRARAVLFLRRRRYGKAVIDSHAARDCARGEERTLCNALLARCFYRSGGIDKAAVTYRGTLWEAPAHRRYHYLAALTAVQVGRYPMARHMLAKAEKAGASGPWMEYVRGHLALNFKSAGEAQEIFAGLCERDPDDPRFLLGWLDAYDRQAKPSETLARIETILTRVDTPELRRRKVELLLTLARGEEADRALTRAIQRFPEAGELRELSQRLGHGAGETVSPVTSSDDAAPKATHATDTQAQGLRNYHGLRTADVGVQADTHNVEDWPAEFRPQWTEADLRREASFLRGLEVQLRVLNALLLREIQTRFGRAKLGYGWALIEPALHMSVFFMLWSFRGRTALDGIPLILFLICGFVPWFLFTNTYGNTVGAVKANAAMLAHATITPFDLVLVKVVLEFFTKITVFVVFLSAVWLVGIDYKIYDISGIMIAFFIMWMLGAGLGLGIEVFSSIFVSLPRVMSMVIRLLYFTSGVMFPISTMPLGFQEILFWNPLVHLITTIRYGFLPADTLDGVELIYPALVMAGLITFSMIALRALQRRVTLT